MLCKGGKDYINVIWCTMGKGEFFLTVVSSVKYWNISYLWICFLSTRIYYKFEKIHYIVNVYVWINVYIRIYTFGRVDDCVGVQKVHVIIVLLIYVLLLCNLRDNRIFVEMMYFRAIQLF